MIIINSDDFGYKPYNQAAYLALKQNLISSVSCFVTYEDGLADALDYVEQEMISVDAIGLHANLSAGIPLTQSMKLNKTFCTDGVYKNDITIRLFYLDKQSKKDVYEELKAQVDKFIETFDTLPSHIDTHHHLHTHWGVLLIFLKVAKEYQIPVVRIARNTGGESMVKSLYKTLVNLKIQSSGFATVNYFGAVEDQIHSGTVYEKHAEIMVHAIFDEDGNLVDMDGEDLKNKISKILKPGQVIKNFTDLAQANSFVQPCKC